MKSYRPITLQWAITDHHLTLLEPLFLTVACVNPLWHGDCYNTVGRIIDMEAVVAWWPNGLCQVAIG